MPSHWPASVQHPFSPSGRQNPYPAYQWLRRNSPVRFDPFMRFWLLTTHADCAAALRDPRFSAALGQRQRLRDDELPPSMLNTDSPEHERLRGPASALTGPAHIQELLGGLSGRIERQLAELPAQVDAYADLGEPYARAVLATLLELPEKQWGEFGELARDASVNLDPLAGPGAAAAGRQVMTELTALLDANLGKVLAAGDDTPLTRLGSDERLTRGEVLGVLGLIVVGGYLPLADLIGNAMYCLVGRPDLIECALRDPDRAMEEVARLYAPIPFTARVTTQDVELAGGTIPAGGRVLLLLESANRDEVVFDRAEEPVLDRSPNPHLAYAAGPHFCLGAVLVRRAAALLLPAVFAEFSGIRALEEDPRWARAIVPRRLVSYRLHLR
ncbi:cytochrome P450 [Nonomuraea sp. LPB2021202275-12-8]|uniref:cytochrome P450 n=1 Tax=Nonomuraea sp. LPB2021202275-12-8 TaxID=3120159 RepID=UPI00300D7A86